MPNNLTPEIQYTVGQIAGFASIAERWSSDPNYTAVSALNDLRSLFPAPADKELWEIKDIEWRHTEDDFWDAETVVGAYEVWKHDEGFDVKFDDGNSNRRIEKDLPTLTLAQSAAAQHYREKIQVGLVKYGEK